MADLTNPFLNTSKLRSQLLADLSSDVEAPTTSADSSQSVANVLGVDQQASQVLGVTANIANNGGEFNPNDTTDYSGYVQSNPVEAWKDFQTYGKAALGVMGMLGMPGMFTGAIAGAVQQNIANTFSDLIGNYVGPLGGVMADKTGLFEAAMRGALPGIGAAADQTSLGNLMNQFGSTEAAIGYFTAATDPNIGNIVNTMVGQNDLTASQYGNVASQVSNAVQSNIAAGMDYNTAVQAANNTYAGTAGGGLDVTNVADTGMGTNAAGQSVSNAATIAAQDAANFGYTPSYSYDSGSSYSDTTSTSDYGGGYSDGSNGSYW